MNSSPPVDGLRDVTEADVYKSGRRAATLRRQGDDIVFAYRSDYVDDPAADPVATTLPRTPTPVVTSGGSVPPFNRLGRRWWTEAATRLSIPEKSIATRLDAITGTAVEWLDRLPEIGFGDPVTERLTTLMSGRIDELRR